MRGELAHPRRRPEDFVPLAEGQAPLTAIVCYADSRVVPELIFDQGVEAGCEEAAKPQKG